MYRSGESCWLQETEIRECVLTGRVSALGWRKLIPAAHRMHCNVSVLYLISPSDHGFDKQHCDFYEHSPGHALLLINIRGRGDWVHVPMELLRSTNASENRIYVILAKEICPLSRSESSEQCVWSSFVGATRPWDRCFSQKT